MNWLQRIGQAITGFRPDGTCVKCGTPMHSDFKHSAWGKGGR